MTKLRVIVSFIAAAVVTFDTASAANLRRYDTNRRLITMEASEIVSSGFIFDNGDSSTSTLDDRISTEAEAGVDSSNLLLGNEGSSDADSLDEAEVNSEVVEGSQDGSGPHLLVEVEANMDGAMPLDGVNAREDAGQDAADADDGDDDILQFTESSHQPDTIQGAPIGDSTWANHGVRQEQLDLVEIM